MRVAPVQDLKNRQESAADLDVWTLLTPATPGDRDGTWLSNPSAKYLLLKFVSRGETPPSGSDINDSDSHVVPGYLGEINVGPRVTIYGLHSATTRSTGFVCWERQ